MNSETTPNDDQPEWVAWVHWNDDTWSRLGADGFPDEPRTIEQLQDHWLWNHN